VQRLTELDLLAKGAIVVLESGEENIEPNNFSKFEVMKSTHYGKKTFVNILLYRGEEE
jgi:16S rRNA G966 N2-methylase RsmD